MRFNESDQAMVEQGLVLPRRYEIASVDRVLTANHRPWYFKGLALDIKSHRQFEFQSADTSKFSRSNQARLEELNQFLLQTECVDLIKPVEAGAESDWFFQIREPVTPNEPNKLQDDRDRTARLKEVLLGSCLLYTSPSPRDS